VYASIRKSGPAISGRTRLVAYSMSNRLPAGKPRYTISHPQPRST